jgi:transposase InsO family protein
MSVIKTISNLLGVTDNGTIGSDKGVAVSDNFTAAVSISGEEGNSCSCAPGVVTKPTAGKTRYTANEKWLIIREGELEGTKPVCERYGISTCTWRDWRNKRDKAITDTDKLGLSGLEDKKSGAKVPVNKLSENIEQEIQKECQRCPGLGPSQIRNQLKRRGIVVSVKSVRRVMMEKQGYKTSAVKKQEEPAVRRFEADRPRQLLQMDILEFYIHKLKVYALIALDDYSRFIMAWKLFTEANMENVIKTFKEMIERYGKVEKVLTDRAMVFYSWKGINQFQKLLEEYEIDQLVAAPHHPQTLGKVEAVNKNLQKELISKVEFSSLIDAEEKIGKWFQHYNYTRTHQGIGGVLVPADRFFGREDEVMEKITEQVNSAADSESNMTDAADGINVTYEPDLKNRVINIFQVIKSGEEIKILVLGKQLILNSGQ